jgi:hypothetical protein
VVEEVEVVVVLLLRHGTMLLVVGC